MSYHRNMGCSELFRRCDFTCQDVTCPKALQIPKTKENALYWTAFIILTNALFKYCHFIPNPYSQVELCPGWPSRSIIAQSLDIAAALRRDAISSWVVLFSNVTIAFLWTLDMIFWIYRVSKYMIYDDIWFMICMIAWFACLLAGNQCYHAME